MVNLWHVNLQFPFTLVGMEELPVRVAGSVFQFIGLICTAWRIHFRLKIGRFWWEDALAAVVLLACLTTLVGEWIYVLTYNLTSNIGFWFYSLGFNTVVRATHLSILFSIIRIVHETRLRRLTYFFAACVGSFWVVVISGKIYHCVSNPGRHHGAPRACGVTSQFLVFEITSDCVTVAVLIALPLRLLWRVKLPTGQRRMILCIFASSVILALAAIFHLLGRTLNIRALFIAGIDFQIATSIIVCNLLVVVTCAYRLLWIDNDRSKAVTTLGTETDSDDFTRPVREPLTLTSIEVDLPVPTTTEYTTGITITAQDDSYLTNNVHVV